MQFKCWSIANKIVSYLSWKQKKAPKVFLGVQHIGNSREIYCCQWPWQPENGIHRLHVHRCKLIEGLSVFPAIFHWGEILEEGWGRKQCRYRMKGVSLKIRVVLCDSYHGTFVVVTLALYLSQSDDRATGSIYHSSDIDNSPSCWWTDLDSHRTVQGCHQLHPAFFWTTELNEGWWLFGTPMNWTAVLSSHPTPPGIT